MNEICYLYVGPEAKLQTSKEPKQISELSETKCKAWEEDNNSFISILIKNTLEVDWLPQHYLYDVTWRGGSITLGSEQLVLTKHAGWGSISNNKLKPGIDVVIRTTSGNTSSAQIASIKYSGRRQHPQRIDFEFYTPGAFLNPIIDNGLILRGYALSDEQGQFMLSNRPIKEEKDQLTGVDSKAFTAAAITGISVDVAVLALSSHLPSAFHSWVLLPGVIVASAVAGGMTSVYYETDRKSLGTDKLSAFIPGLWVGGIGGLLVAAPVALVAGIIHWIFGASVPIFITNRSLFGNAARPVTDRIRKFTDRPLGHIIESLKASVVKTASRPMRRTKESFRALKRYIQ